LHRWLAVRKDRQPFRIVPSIAILTSTESSMDQVLAIRNSPTARRGYLIPES